MADRELPKFISKFKERYKQNLRMRRAVVAFNRLLELESKRELDNHEQQEQYFLWLEIKNCLL